MKSNLKVVLSAVALAALVAAPAVAKSRTQQTGPAVGYSNGAALHDGSHALSSDPDARVRSEIQRDGASSYE